jgi:hypothetical protein
VEESVQEDGTSADPLNFGITLVVRVGAKAPRLSPMRANVFARCAVIESVRNEMSPGKKARNVGTPLAPFGAMNIVFALWGWRAPVSVPEVVTGLPDTENTEEGSAKPTDETPPPPPPVIGTLVALVMRPKESTVPWKTWVASP